MEPSEDLAGNGAGDTSGAWDVEDSHDEASDSDDPAGDQVVVASGGGLEQGVLDLLGLPDEPGARACQDSCVS
jgi:hypothetical protein